MMGKSKFSDKLKRDAVAQITERGYPGSGGLDRRGVSPYLLYAWNKNLPASSGSDAKGAEIRRLKRELARVTEARNILRESHRVFRQGCKVRYALVVEQHPLPKRNAIPFWKFCR